MSPSRFPSWGNGSPLPGLGICSLFNSRRGGVMALGFLLLTGAPRGASGQAMDMNDLIQKLMGGQGAAAKQQETEEAAAERKRQERPEGQASVEVVEDSRFEIHMGNVPLDKVLHMLSMKGKRNIIASPEVTGTVTAHFYGVTLEEALDAILYTNNAAYESRGQFIFVYTLEEMDSRRAEANPPISKVFMLNYLAAAEVAPMVTPLLSEIGQVTASSPAERGIATDPESAGGDAMAAQDFIVVFDVPDRLDQITRMIAEIDVRPRQVLVEATILRAQLTEDNSLGIDFTVTGGVDLEMLGATSNGVTDLTVGQLSGPLLEELNTGASTNFMPNVPSNGLKFGILKDQIGLFLRALEAVVDTTVIANPKVLALNKQRGEVIVGREDGYPIITVTETASVQSTALVKTGTRLLFRPFISEDGWVRMELHPEDSVGGVTGDQPFKETTEVTTNIMLRDGQTILIGGLFRDSTTSKRSQLPGWGNIPILGLIGSSTQDVTDREEVIILLTVHIVKDADAYAKAGQEQLEDAERIRVGARRGTMFHGRERMAQSFYREATEAYAAGELDKALWNVQLALHHNSRFQAAIELKETILRARDWQDPLFGGGRDFTYERIEQDSGSASSEHPVEVIPLPDADASHEASVSVEVQP